MKLPSFNIRNLIREIVLPFTILGGCGTVFSILGTTSPPSVPPAANSMAELMQALPPAGVAEVRDISEIGGVVNIQADGQVVPYREIQLASEVTGQIVYKSERCEAGNFVEKDELLFRIDKTDYELEVERLTKQQDQEYQSLREIDQEITNVEKLIELATEDVKLRENEIERLERLPNGFASASEIDAAKRSRLQAMNTRLGHENQLDLLKKRRVTQQAKEALVQTQLKLAQTNLARTEIRSPVSGVIYREDVELNSFVQRGTVLARIEDTTKVEVLVNLRMNQMHWVLDQAFEEEIAKDEDQRGYHIPRTPATVRYRVSGRDTVYEWAGQLERYDGVGLDSKSRMVPVRVVVNDPNVLQIAGDSEAATPKGAKALVRGMYVQVVLHAKPQSPLSLVPNLALQPGNRLWKFSPDISVLSASSEDANSEDQADSKSEAGSENKGPATTNVSTQQASVETGSGDKEDAEKSKPSETPSVADGFNPATWTAGRLDVLRNVNAITAVDINVNDEPQKFWICETSKGSLSAGDFVVVTPLGGVTGDGKDFIRAEITSPEDAATDGEPTN